MPLFSVIVPVYKVEPYIRRCIESVLVQSYKDFELILVDDGSPDKCGEICDEYALGDNRIQVIHKKNGGLSDARNFGVRAATGEYVLFLDSDDYFANENVLQSLKERIAGFREELILYSTIDVFANGQQALSRGKYDIPLINYHNKKDTLNYLYSTNNFPGAAWIFCVKRNLLINNTIEFPLGVTAEDYIWIIKVLKAAKSIGACNDAIVSHLQDSPGSITSRPRLSGVEGIHLCLSYFLHHQKDFYDCSGIKNQMGYAYMIALLNYSGLNEKDKLAAKRMLKEDFEVLSYCNDKKIKIIRCFIKIFGLGFVSKLIKVYQRHK